MSIEHTLAILACHVKWEEFHTATANRKMAHTLIGALIGECNSEWMVARRFPRPRCSRRLVSV